MEQFFSRLRFAAAGADFFRDAEESVTPHLCCLGNECFSARLRADVAAAATVDVELR